MRFTVTALLLAFVCTASSACAEGTCSASLQVLSGSPVGIRGDLGCRIDPEVSATHRLLVAIDARNAGAFPVERVSQLLVYAIREDTPQSSVILGRADEAAALLQSAGLRLHPTGEPVVSVRDGKDSVTQEYYWPASAPPGVYLLMALLPPTDSTSCRWPMWAWSNALRAIVGPLSGTEMSQVLLISASLLERDGRADDAVSAFLEAAALDVDSVEAPLSAAELLAKQGRSSAAAVQARVALKRLDPARTDEASWMQRGRVEAILRDAP